MVYPWIFPAFWNQISRRPVLLVSLNAYTRAGDQECFIPRATMAIAPGEKVAHQRLNPTAANVPCLIDGSEPMQNDQEHFFSDIFLKSYNIIKKILKL